MPSADISGTLPVPKLKAGGKKELDELMTKIDKEGEIPCMWWMAANVNETIYESARGYNEWGDEKSGAVDMDSTVELFSQTKLITCVSAMQLVQAGKIGLDDSEALYKLCPELGEVKLLETGETPKNKITLRMLMSHTAGFGYPNRDNYSSHWTAENPLPPALISAEASVESLKIPLLFEPATDWAYGNNIDWTGLVVMRLSGLTLDDYFKQHIYPCVPGGMPDSSFYPLPNIVKHKTAVYKWDGEKIERWKGYGMDRPNTMEGYSKTFHSGGGGLFGTLRDYLEFVRALLQCDPRSPTKPAKPLLGPEAYAELYAPSIKSQKGIETMVASAKGSNVWNNPDPTPETCNHSVAGMLILGDWTGMRKKGSLSWGGAAHTHFWLDPASGIVGVCGTQINGNNPMPWNEVQTAFETALYANLQV